VLPALIDPAAVAASDASAACTLASGPRLSVARVIDSETLALHDGSEVRLIGALAPRVAGEAGLDLPREREARSALEGLVLGRDVALRYGARKRDRYGRHLAHVYVSRGERALWVQGFLIEKGLARAYAIAGNAECLEELLAMERAARESRLGLWGSAAYRVLDATEVRELMARRNGFAVVEGIVRDAARRGGPMFLNFGDDWRRDFTAVVPPRILRQSADSEARLSALVGRRVRVRGWVEWRNGPSIEIQSLAEIEDADVRAAAEHAKRPVAGDTGASQ
jgi:endonuclease YncB( thermonuclease family)